MIWGVLIAFLSVLRLVGPARSVTLALVTVAAGGLAVLSAFLIDESPGPTANLALMGLAVVILSLIGLAADSEDRRTSRG